MESIKNSLKTSFKKEVDKNYTKEKLNSKIINLAKMNKLTEEEIKNNLSSLEDSIEELNNCKKCPGLSKCPNHIKGYVYYPNKNESKVVFNYIPCKVLKDYENSIESKKGSTILENARMKDIDVSDKKRVKLIKWLKEFYDNYDVTKKNKGLYLHGTFGSGKTFLIAALLNELKENKNVKYELIYFPELLRSLKDDFSFLDSKVRYYSNIEILVIDDIGAEKVSDWGRDEVLGTILQYRMNNGLTTFFTSNLSIEELEKHLSYSKDSIDVVKARRIIERIISLTDDIELISIDRRN